MWANGARGSREKLHGVLRRGSVVVAKSLMEKSEDVYVDSDLFIKLYEIARAAFRSPNSEKIKCGQRQNAFRTVRIGCTVVYVYAYVYIKPVLYNSKLKRDNTSFMANLKNKIKCG